MLIIIGDLRKKAMTLLKSIGLLALLCVVGLGIATLYDAYAPTVSTWIQKESAKTGPMDIESAQKTWFDEKMDMFVIKMQDFYYEEQE